MAHVAVNGDVLHYDDVGEVDAPAVIWGHGFTLAAGSLRPVVNAMPTFRHVIVDFRGHGRSAAVTSDPTLWRMADDTWEIAQHLGLDRFFYVGHSMGSAVGMRLAARHPLAVVAGVGLAAVQGGGNPEVDRQVPEALAALVGNQEAMAAALSGLFAHPGNKDLAAQMGRAAALLDAGPLRTIATRELFLDEADGIFRHLHQPWLFVVPSEDKAISPDHQFEWARAVPNSRVLWLEGEGHVFPQEIPDETAAFVKSFLTRHI